MITHPRNNGYGRNRCSSSSSLLRRRHPLLLWLFVVVFATTNRLVKGQRQKQQQRGSYYSMETARHDMLRSPEKQQRAATDLTNHKVLSRRETHRLTKTLRRNKDLADIDIEILIASTVEFGYTPKELATELLNRWDMGSRPEQAGAILVMMVMDENRIEIEVSDSLAHIFGADWCHDILYTRAVPWFKHDRYDRGLEELLDAIASTMKQVRSSSSSSNKKPSKRKRRVGLAALMGAYGLTHPFWWRWFEKDRKDESSDDYSDGNNDHHFWGGDRKDIGGRKSGWKPYESPSFSRNNAALFGLGSFLLGRKLGSRSAWRSKTTNSWMTAGARARPEDRTAIVGEWPYVSNKGHSSPIRGRLVRRSIRTEEHRQRLDKEAEQRNEKQDTSADITKTSNSRSSGWGGGASWSRDFYSTKKNRPYSGFESGATWSHSYSDAKRNKNHKTKNSHTTASRESSSNGGGASW